MLTVYGYQKCSSCRDALKWLDARSLIYQVKAIRETPPTPTELTTALKAMGGDLRKLFNTSGIDYRALGLKDQLPSMSEASAFELLSKWQSRETAISDRRWQSVSRLQRTRVGESVGLDLRPERWQLCSSLGRWSLVSQ